MARKKKGQKTITEKILEELRKGTPLKKIKEKHKGGAQLYNAFSLFFQEVEAKVSEKQSLNAEINALKATLERLKQENTQFTNEGKDLENLIQEKNGQLRTVKKNIEDREKALSELKVLDDKDISVQVIHSISNMDVKNRKDLLTRMKTIEAYNQEKQSYHELVANKKTLEKELKKNTAEKTCLESKIKVLNEDVNSAKQQLDEAQNTTKLYKEVVEVTQSYLQDGYSIPDLKSLRMALKAIQVKGNPTTSLKRLIEGLQNMKTLNRINDEIDGKTNELTVLNSNIKKVKGILDGYQQHLLSTFAETNQSLIDTMAKTNEKTLNGLQVWEKAVADQLTEVGKNYVGHICKLDENVKISFGNAEKSMDTHLKVMVLQTEDVTGEIQKMGKVAAGITTYLDSETERVTNKLKNSIFVITQQFIKDMEEYNKLKDKIRDQEILQQHSQYFLGFLDQFDRETLEKIPIPFLLQILMRIRLYVEFKFPDEKVSPKHNDPLFPYGVTGFNSATSYKLASTLDLFTQGLNEQWRKIDGAST